MERLHNCVIVKNCSLELQVPDPSRPLTPWFPPGCANIPRTRSAAQMSAGHLRVLRLTSREGRGGVGSLTRFIGRDNKSERGVRRKRFSAILACALLVSVPLAAPAADAEAQQVTVHLGDYRFQPETIEVVAGRPVELTLINDDKITPHNLTLKESGAGIDLNAAVSAGKSTTLRFTPQTAGSYTFYCNKKLPFMKSHRERGMEGKLTVRPAP